MSRASAEYEDKKKEPFVFRTIKVKDVQYILGDNCSAKSLLELSVVIISRTKKHKYCQFFFFYLEYTKFDQS